MTKLPRKVWAYWDYGSVPVYESLCIEGWKRMLPGWEVRVVMGRGELQSLVPKDYLPRDWSRLSVHQKSDSARIALLRAHGGVWMDASIVLFNDYQWVIDLVEKEGKTFVCYAMHANGKPDPQNDNKRGDEAIENWWFATPKEGAVIRRWNEVWVDWLNTGLPFGEIQSYRDEPWWNFNKEDNHQKRYLASEVALMRARNRIADSKKEFDEGRVWIRNAQKGPFILSQKVGWHNPQWEKFTLQDLFQYEKKELGHPLRFAKFTGGQTVWKTAALDPIMQLPERSAARFLFLLALHGIQDEMTFEREVKSGTGVGLDGQRIVPHTRSDADKQVLRNNYSTAIVTLASLLIVLALIIDSLNVVKVANATKVAIRKAAPNWREVLPGGRLEVSGKLKVPLPWMLISCSLVLAFGLTLVALSVYVYKTEQPFSSSNNTMEGLEKNGMTLSDFLQLEKEFKATRSYTTEAEMMIVDTILRSKKNQEDVVVCVEDALRGMRITENLIFRAVSSHCSPKITLVADTDAQAKYVMTKLAISDVFNAERLAKHKIELSIVRDTAGIANVYKRKIRSVFALEVHRWIELTGLIRDRAWSLSSAIILGDDESGYLKEMATKSGLSLSTTGKHFEVYVSVFW